MSTDNIAATIELARGGDTGAFAQIVRQYQSLVSGVLFNITGDFHKSEDFTQETFLIAWQKLGELRDTEHLAAWLCTIARNLVHRSHRKATVLITSLDATGGLASAALAPPDTEMLRKEQSEFVWSAIGEIDAKYRETLVLYYRSGQSVREIAAATGATEEAVRQRLVRARKSLKTKLEEMVGNILTDTIPGEAFTLTVMTALGATMLTTTAQAAVVATTGTTAATGGVATGKGALGTATIWSVIGPAAFFGWFMAILLVASWAGVRNAPTLRARRLRVHSFFWFVQYCFLFSSIHAVVVGTIFYWASTLCRMNLPEFLCFFIMFSFCSLIIIPFQLAHQRRMKRIIEDDLGLSEQQGRLPTAGRQCAVLHTDTSEDDLTAPVGCADATVRRSVAYHCHRVESYSYPQVERRFFLSLVTNWLLAITIIAVLVGTGVVSGEFHHPAFFYLTLAVIVVAAVATAVFYPLGRYFLEICRTKQNFLASPPLVDNPFEVVLMKSGKHHASVDHPKKTGGMFGMFLLVWIGYAGGGVWYFAQYSWDKHPILLGIFAVLSVLILWTGSVLIKRMKNRRNAISATILQPLCIAILALALEYIEFGGFYFSDLWTKQRDPRNVIHVMNLTALLVIALQMPLQLYHWFKAKREEDTGKESGRDALLREAIERYNPATMITDEPEVAAKPFPRRWFWIIGLYAAAIVVMGCLGVLLR